MSGLFALEADGRLLPGPAGLSEEQAQALALDRHIVVTAGAGSGKTRTLARRYVRILGSFAWEEASGAVPRASGPEAVVVTTFTRRAAAEMRGRIRAELGVAVRELRDERERLAALPGLSLDLVDRLRAHLSRCREGFERARIDTFHGFCGVVLREFAPAAGLNPEFGLLDGSDQLILMREAVDAALTQAERGGEPAALFSGLRRREVAELLLEWVRRRSDLGPFRRVLAEHDEEGLLRIWLQRYGAGDLDAMDAAVAPGGSVHAALSAIDAVQIDWGGDEPPGLLTGVERALAVAGVVPDPHDIPARADRLRALVGPFLLATGAFRSIRGTGKFFGKKAGWTGDGYPAMKAAWALTHEQLTAVFGEEAAALDGLPGEVDRTSVEVLRALSLVGGDALGRYALAKDERHALDFEDLQIHLLRLIEEHDDVRLALQSRFRHVLVDEFQDTNALQWRLVRRLLGDPLPGAGLFVVGDPKQAIYRFRGGDVSLFDRAIAELEGEGGRIVRFTANYRSRSGLIEVFNDLFRYLLAPAEGPRPSWEAPFSALTSGRRVEAVDPTAPDEGRVEILRVEEAEDGEASGDPRADEGELVDLEGVAREAAVVAERLEAWLPELPEHDGLQVALLFRRRRNLPLFAQALRRRGIPHTVASGRGFYGRQEVRDLAGLLLAMAHRDDLVSLLGALRGPFLGLEDAWLVWLARSGRSAGPHALRQGWDDLVGAIDAADRGADPGATARLGFDELPAEGRRALHRAASRWTRWDRLRRLLPLSVFLRRLLDESAAGHLFAMEDPSGQVPANIEKLLALAIGYDSHGSEGAADFAGRLRALEEAEAVEGDAAVDASASVVLMTIHQSKGLEFPCVVLADLHAAIQPPGAPPRIGRLSPGADASDPAERWELGLRLPVVEDGRRRHRRTLIGACIKLRNERENRAENKRLLYVAMTRARDRVLCVHRPPKGKAVEPRGREGSRSWEEWLRSWEAEAMEVEEPAWTRQSVLPPGISGSASSARIPVASEAPADLIELAEVRDRIGPVGVDRLTRVAPSALLREEPGASKSPAGPELDPLLGLAEPPAREPVPAALVAPLVPSRGIDPGLLARLRGTLVHECLEDGITEPSAATEHRISRLLAEEGFAEDRGARDRLRRDLHRHLRGWNEAAPAALRSLDPRVPVFRELPFRLPLPSGPDERRRLEGQIDVLYRDPERDLWVVLDYKTDRSPPDELSARYRPQLLAYAWAASRIVPELREGRGRILGELLLTHHGLRIEVIEPTSVEQLDRAFAAVRPGATGSS